MDEADKEADSADKTGSGVEPQSAYPEEEDSAVSDVEYEAFYHPSDIEVTRERQKADLFKDVNTERSEILMEGDPKNHNYLDIAQIPATVEKPFLSSL